MTVNLDNEIYEDEEIRTIAPPEHEILDAKRIMREFSSLPVCAVCGGVDFHYSELYPENRYCSKCGIAMKYMQFEKAEQLFNDLSTLRLLVNLWDLDNLNLIYDSRIGKKYDVKRIIKKILNSYDEFKGIYADEHMIRFLAGRLMNTWQNIGYD